VARAEEEVARAAEGSRNNTLFAQTAALVELANGGALDPAVVAPAMLAAATAAGLPAREATATIESAFRAVGDRARSLPAPADPPGGILVPRRPQPLADLLTKHFPPVSFLVQGLLARGNLAVLGGRPKSGKSWLVLQLAQAIDSGKVFLNRPTQMARVLYVAREDGEQRIQQRIQELDWRPDSAALLTELGPFDGIDGPGPGLSELRNLAGDYGLIIVDTLIACLTWRSNENNNTQMGEIINTLAGIAHDKNVAIVLVHHTGKASLEDPFNLLRGASAIRGACDLVMVLERKGQEKEAVLHMEGRDLDTAANTIRQNAGGAGWQYVGDQGAIAHIRVGRAVLEAMRQHGDPVTAAELAQLMGVKASSVREQLKRLEQQGLVQFVQERRVGVPKPVAVWQLR
jgi:hypothetical protein